MKRMEYNPGIFLRIVFCLSLVTHFNPLQAQQTTGSVVILFNGIQKDEYCGEILRAQGFHSFEYLDISRSSFSVRELSRADLVILPKMILRESSLSILFDYVGAGGQMIVICPQPSMAGRLDLKPANKIISDGYIKIDPAAVTGPGLLGQPLQWHGDALLFDLAGGKNRNTETIASLFEKRGSGRAFPGVTYSRVAGGRVISFLYDLSGSTMLSRQGNAKLAALETDSINGIRPMDMFTGGWVDTVNNTINQADEQLLLFSRCLETLTMDRMPQPRCWYFPGNLKSLVVLTNDGEYRSAKDFSRQFADVSEQEARMTLYVLSPEKIDSAFTDSAVRNGFEISAHPDATREAGNPTWQGVNNAISSKLRDLNRFPGASPIRTNTNHWFVWCGRDSAGKLDFSSGAKIEAMNGIRMDVNYAHYDNKAAGKRFLGPTGYRQGNFTGSGLPMKFGSPGGGVVDVYQLLNNVYDQEYMENQDPDGYESCFRGLLDRSLHEQVFSFICIRAHNDEYFFSKEPLMRMLGYARENKIPVWPAGRLLQFLTARDSVSFKDLVWTNQRLTFRVESRTYSPDSVSILLPEIHNRLKLVAASRNGEKATMEIQEIKGKKYCRISFLPGKDCFVAADYW